MVTDSGCDFGFDDYNSMKPVPEFHINNLTVFFLFFLRIAVR